MRKSRMPMLHDAQSLLCMSEELLVALKAEAVVYCRFCRKEITGPRNWLGTMTLDHYDVCDQAGDTCRTSI